MHGRFQSKWREIVIHSVAIFEPGALIVSLRLVDLGPGQGKEFMR